MNFGYLIYKYVFVALELEKEISCLEFLSVSLLVHSLLLLLTCSRFLHFYYCKCLRRTDTNVCEYKNFLQNKKKDVYKSRTYGTSIIFTLNRRCEKLCPQKL
jgi:hypothetical protein